RGGPGSRVSALDGSGLAQRVSERRGEGARRLEASAGRARRRDRLDESAAHDDTVRKRRDLARVIRTRDAEADGDRKGRGGAERRDQLTQSLRDLGPSAGDPGARDG